LVYYRIRPRILSLARFDGAGRPIGPEVPLAQLRHARLDLVWTGREYGVVDGDPQGPVSLLRLGPEGGEAGLHVVAGDGNRAAAGAWSGVSYGLAWRSAEDEVRFTVLCGCPDADEDGFGVCADCDERDATVHPGAPQLCDRVANDCLDPRWPEPPAEEIDEDGDGFADCEGDCEDLVAAVHPGAEERCNGVDDDCDGQVDEGFVGDADGDGVVDACDNCPERENAGQEDADRDGLGDACDECFHNAFGPSPDADGDGEVDFCDVDDGAITVQFASRELLVWDGEQGYEAWNVYRGDLGVLRATGEYTQAPGSNGLAGRACGLGEPRLGDAVLPEVGGVAFYLASGMAQGIEGSLGVDGAGNPRPNTHPCP
jgi:hypothetical protein